MFGNKKKYTEIKQQLESTEQAYNNLHNQFVAFQYEYFDGEKEAGEMGSPVPMIPDYYAARERAWRLNLTNDIAKSVVNKWVTWLIGKGLRFNFTPPKQEYIETERNTLIKDVEFRFRNYLSSKYCDFSQMVNFNKIASTAVYNSKVAGDVLCVLRVKNGYVSAQLIDGANVITPVEYSGTNKIIDGVELDTKNKHVAFWVWKENGKVKRIEAEHKQTGLKLAFMIYGAKFRLNETRGVSMLLENFEKIKNLERYIEATVKNVEISSETVYVNEHDATSTGENIFKSAASKTIAGNVQSNSNSLDWPSPKCFQNNLAKTTKGLAINNTVGGKLKLLKPEAENMMPNFVKANLEIIFASAEIPFEVAMSVYGSNYSASKAARNDWQHVLEVKTQEIAENIYEPFFNLWLYNEVLTGRILYPELYRAYQKNDVVMISALNKASFTGVSVSDIDPLKTVNAVRRAMGDDFTPIMTGERAAEIVSNQDFAEIQEQVKNERENSVKPEIKKNEL